MQDSPIAVALNAAWNDIAAGLKAGHEVSVYRQDSDLAILSDRWDGSQDSFMFRTDHLTAHTDVPSSEPSAGWQIAAIAHEQAQVAVSGDADLHSNLAGAAPDVLAGSHLADLLSDHFIIR